MPRNGKSGRRAHTDALRDADAWSPYAATTPEGRILFTVFDAAEDLQLQAGARQAAPQIHLSMTPAQARRWADALAAAAGQAERAAAAVALGAQARPVDEDAADR